MSQADETQRRLAAIVETSDDAIVSKNLHGIVQSWNAAAERIFGFTAEEIIGHPINMIIPPDRQDEERVILDRLSRGERVDHFQTIRMRKDGTLIDVSVTISPIQDATGRIIGASKIARDITDYRRLLRERDQLLTAERTARSEADRANRMKDEFISTLSHELRTPLNAIVGWAQLMRQSKNDPDTIAEGVAVIERNAKAQTQLIEDLLDLGRIMSGKVRLEVHPLDLTAVIDAAIESVKPSADVKQISLRRVMDYRAAAVSGDPNRLQQVVWNLLTNAIKFTPRGGSIEVVLERINSHARIAVRDSGVGIKAEFLPHVFDRFRQGDASITRQHGGLGIGLSIVKQLVELHAGSVKVTSEGEGRGACFYVELPLAVTRHDPRANDTAGAAGLAEAMSGISLEGMTVLVVDDEADTRDILGRLLQHHHARVFAADSVDHALDLMTLNHLDVLVSDIGMPQKDGYEFMRAVRRMTAEHGGKVPAIALTAFVRPEDRTRAMLAGYQVHLSKPVDGQELIAAIASLGGRTGSN